VTDEQAGPPESVSVVIPTYNRADLLDRAIASAVNQTHPAYEVIVVDDGSSDDTPARCAAWGSRIRYVRTANAGVSVARNTGISLAQGQWIALLDSDDTWEPTKLEVQMAAFRAVPAAAWSLTGCEVVDGEGAVHERPESFEAAFPLFREFGIQPERFFAQYLERFEVTTAGVHHDGYHGDLFRLLFLGNVVLPSSAVVRRELIDRIGGFDASLRMCEETEFFHRAAAYAPGIVLMSRLVRYRAAHHDSLTAGVNAAPLAEAALRSLDAAATRRQMQPADRDAWSTGRRTLLLRLAYAYLSVRDGRAVRRTLRRLRKHDLPLGRRGTALWGLSLLPPPALSTLHAGKRLLRRVKRGPAGR